MICPKNKKIKTLASFYHGLEQIREFLSTIVSLRDEEKIIIIGSSLPICFPSM